MQIVNERKTHACRHATFFIANFKISHLNLMCAYLLAMTHLRGRKKLVNIELSTMIIEIR